MKTISNKTFLKMGALDGIPIALGYLAVSFSLGIQAKQAGLDALAATIMSLTNVTSAGEFAALGIISEGGTLATMACSQFIINLRYMLMSCSLSQKIDNEKPFFHRFGVAFGVTDEIFGISYAVKGRLNPFYTYGAMLVAIPGWCLGTCLGVIFGNLLPEVIVTSLGVALYGMFIAIIIPPSKKDRCVAAAVILAMICSIGWDYIHAFHAISGGTKIIILTVVISLAFAILFPRNEEAEESKEAES